MKQKIINCIVIWLALNILSVIIWMLFKFFVDNTIWLGAFWFAAIITWLISILVVIIPDDK